MQIPDNYIFAWRKWRGICDKYLPNKPLRLSVWVIAVTCVGIALLALGEIDPDKRLLKTFFSFRGAYLPPDKVQLVAFTKKDFEPPLKLSPKYNMTGEQFQTLVTRILQAEPAKVFIDDAILPDVNGEDQKEVNNLLTSSNVAVYSEQLYEVKEPYWARLLSIVPPMEVAQEEAPIILTNGQVLRLPNTSSIYDNNSEASLINFYGPTGTIPALSFSDAILGETRILSSFQGKIVFIGRQTSVFNRGNVVSKYHVPSIGDAEMSHLEIQATAFANVRDGRAIKVLPRRAFYFCLAVVFLLSIGIMQLNYWVTVPASFLLIAALAVTEYQYFVRHFWWFEGEALLIILPLVAFLLHSLMTVFRIAKKDKDTKKSYFLD